MDKYIFAINIFAKLKSQNGRAAKQGEVNLFAIVPENRTQKHYQNNLSRQHSHFSCQMWNYRRETYEVPAFSFQQVRFLIQFPTQFIVPGYSGSCFICPSNFLSLRWLKKSEWDTTALDSRSLVFISTRPIAMFPIENK